MLRRKRREILRNFAQIQIDRRFISRCDRKTTPHDQILQRFIHQMFKISLTHFAILFLGTLLIGCAPTALEPDLTSILDKKPRTASEPRRYQFDFGAVVARDQTLRHEFRLTNPTNRPLRLLGFKVGVPCCSSLGKCPDLIPAGGEVPIIVNLKAGHVADQKRVGFEIKTDLPADSIVTLVVSARFLPEWEIKENPGQPVEVKVGQKFGRTYQLVGRRKGGEGRKIPVGLTAIEPLHAHLVGTPQEFEGSDGIIESFQDLDVRLVAGSDTGNHKGSILYRWPDGLERTQEIYWVVKPKIEISPATLVLKPSNGSMQVKVRVHSADQPYRIVRIFGALLAAEVSVPVEAATDHSL